MDEGGWSVHSVVDIFEDGGMLCFRLMARHLFTAGGPGHHADFSCSGKLCFTFLCNITLNNSDGL